MSYVTFCIGLLMLSIPRVGHAIWVNPCPLGNCGYLPTTIANITGVAITVFGGFLFAMFVFYGIRLLLSTKDDNAQTEIRGAYVYALFGIVLVAGAIIISDSVTGSSIVDANAISTMIFIPLKNFIKGLASIAIIVTITFQGIRLILSNDESQSSAVRKRFIEGLIGAMAIVLADRLVKAFAPSGQGDILSEEIAGIARFLATIFGALAVIAIMVGGAFLVFSAQDSMKDRGKQIIIAGIVSLIVVFSAYGLATIFM